MFERVTVTVSDMAASRRFYETVLGAIGRSDWADFELVAGADATRGLHIGFGAQSRADVDAFWQAGVDAGYASDGEPGERPQYSPTYYGGFLLDPDGNSAEALHRAGMRTDGTVDHLWLRVRDLEVSAAFYRSLPGIRQAHVVPGERHHFEGGEHGGTFGVVTDGRPVTEHLSMAFAGPEPGTLRDPDGNRIELVAR